MTETVIRTPVLVSTSPRNISTDVANSNSISDIVVPDAPFYMAYVS